MWLGGLAWLASRVLRALSPGVTTRLERISAAVMIALGLRIAAQAN
ncbi:hypothetical protein [Planosporangium mesophilum]|uniref:Uncharacterized protein n=1 Tax=Planosporangium mesophilum TaxID=689768 RepID=A0A8J3TR51_9ACTN|nr:hypothetical protein [Planosporangium mesophilum]NJC86623.1 hypothetical protein [Planosporangium mesophilum]GII25815.1 hypothetical protein Pme01_54120 [Planosporangium mesophilum]